MASIAVLGCMLGSGAPARSPAHRGRGSVRSSSCGIAPWDRESGSRGGSKARSQSAERTSEMRALEMRRALQGVPGVPPEHRSARRRLVRETSESPLRQWNAPPKVHPPVWSSPSRRPTPWATDSPIRNRAPTPSRPAPWMRHTASSRGKAQGDPFANAADRRSTSELHVHRCDNPAAGVSRMHAAGERTGKRIGDPFALRRDPSPSPSRGKCSADPFKESRARRSEAFKHVHNSVPGGGAAVCHHGGGKARVSQQPASSPSRTGIRTGDPFARAASRERRAKAIAVRVGEDGGFPVTAVSPRRSRRISAVTRSSSVGEVCRVIPQSCPSPTSARRRLVPKDQVERSPPRKRWHRGDALRPAPWARGDKPRSSRGREASQTMMFTRAWVESQASPGAESVRRPML